MRELVAMALVCLVLALASLAGLVWAITNAPVLGLDGLLLILVCLLVGGIFSLNLLWLVLKTPLREVVRQGLGPVLKFRPRSIWKPSRAAEVKVSDGDSSGPSEP